MCLLRRTSFLLIGLFSRKVYIYAEMKGSRPLLDIPSHEGLGAVNSNEEVTGPHSPSTSGARRSVCGSPIVLRSFNSAAALPFFHVRQSRRLLAAADHCDIASFGNEFFNLLQFLFFH